MFLDWTYLGTHRFMGLLSTHQIESIFADEDYGRYMRGSLRGGIRSGEKTLNRVFEVPSHCAMC